MTARATGSHPRIVAIAATLIAIATPAGLALGQPKDAAGAAAPPLGGYGIALDQTSVSGVSSGGAMAVQMHIAHASIMRGVGVIAGIAYDCANSGFPFTAQRRGRGVNECMPGRIAAAFSEERTRDAAQAHAIDDPDRYLRGQKVWLFSGYNDGLVRRPAMDAVEAHYKLHVDAGNVFYKTDNAAAHALVTDDFGARCPQVDAAAMTNCDYDAAGRLLAHIYGHLNDRVRRSDLHGALLAFDQREFVRGLADGEPRSIGLADAGYVYVPQTCRPSGATPPCRVHVFFHGCEQYAAKVDQTVVRNAGYNEWAETNNIVVLYPQTIATEGILASEPINPKGCWDWWGYARDRTRNIAFARKAGFQIVAVRAMLARLASGAPASPASAADTFGPPQDVTAVDATSRAVALTWRPNTAADGFNVYRSATRDGAYTKINDQPVAGGSFVDHGLTPTTTYHYQIVAVRGPSQESARTDPVSRTTARELPACETYFSDNWTHWWEDRAYRDVGGNVFAWGSGDPMGAFSTGVFTQLVHAGNGVFRADTCHETVINSK